MAFSSRHWLLTVHGNLFSSGGVANEHWSFGMRLVGSAAQVAPTQADVDAFAAPIKTWYAAGACLFSIAHKLEYIKLAPIGADGKYPGVEDAVEHVPVPLVGGANSTGQVPGQNTVAVSLTTNLSRGRAHIGRIYPPPQAFTLTSGGQIDQVQAQAYLTATKTMVDGVNNAGPSARVYIMSKFGDQQVVTGVRVGRTVDTQRRRRASIPETPLSVSLG